MQKDKIENKIPDKQCKVKRRLAIRKVDFDEVHAYESYGQYQSIYNSAG